MQSSNQCGNRLFGRIRMRKNQRIPYMDSTAFFIVQTEFNSFLSTTNHRKRPGMKFHCVCHLYHLTAESIAYNLRKVNNNKVVKDLPFGDQSPTEHNNWEMGFCPSPN